MAVQRVRRNTVYGYPSPQAGLFPDPVIQQRAPTAADQGEIGQLWVNTSANTAYFLTSIASGSSVWTESGSGGGGSFTSLSVSGTSSLVGTVTTGGQLNVGSNAVVTSNTSTATLNVSGASTLTGTTTLGGAFKLTGANVGTATLVAGTVTVSSSLVTASSKIFLSFNTPGGTQGFLSQGTIVAGTSFVINSSSATDTSTVNWFIIN